jgi:xanthine dehydrogenase accessory factor
LEKDVDMKDLTIAILGAGEMATGIAHRLYSSNLKRIVMSDIAAPIAVRRKVSFCEAVYEKKMTVEGLKGVLVADLSDLSAVWDDGAIGILVDENASFVPVLKPDVVIDATMMKRPKGPMTSMAPLVVGMGPGFHAPDQVHVVVESNRGHDMGRVIYDGEAEPFSGIPGTISGFTSERVLRAPHDGKVRTVRDIGDTVKKGDLVLYVDDTPVYAGVDGMVRGLIRPIKVPQNEKVGDVDPRGTDINCRTISEKARALAGGVLEAIMHRFNVID